MGYRQGGYRSPLAAGAGVVVAVLIGLRLLTGLGSLGGGPGLGTGGLDTSEGVENALVGNPEVGRFYQTMKRTYPDEFDSLKLDISGRARAGATQDQIERAIADDVDTTIRQHSRQMLQAPHAALAAYRAAEIKMLEGFQASSPGLCSNYVMQGQTRIPNREQHTTASLIDFKTALLEAAAAGRDHPVGREVAEPTKADWRLIHDGMVASGLPKAQADQFFADGGIEKASASDQCATGLAFLKAINQLPGEIGDSVLAYLASKSH